MVSVMTEIDTIIGAARQFIRKHGPFKVARMAGFREGSRGILRNYEDPDWNPTTETLRKVESVMKGAPEDRTVA